MFLGGIDWVGSLAAAAGANTGFTEDDREELPDECDVLVVGSGAAGLTAAVTAAAHGLKVVVAEKQPLLGGTTTRTSGSMWLPCNRIAAARGIADDPDRVRVYLRAAASESLNPALVDAYLANAPRVLNFFLDETSVRLYCPVTGSDYHPELPCGMEVGRVVYTEPFDARALGRYFGRMTSPPDVFTFGGVVPDLGTEVLRFTNANRSLTSAFVVARRVARQAYDQVVYGRGTRLTNGAALAGRLLKSAIDRGVRLLTSCPVSGLTMHDGRVSGAVLDAGERRFTIRVRRGVVLASGGFSHDPELRQRFFPKVLKEHPYWPATAATAAGSGMRLGLSVGAAANGDMLAPAAWAPMSLVPGPNGSVGVLPVVWGRALPGVIAVMRNGKRFVNEALTYHEFGAAMIAATPENEEAYAFLVCDATALRRYGLGYVKPFPVPHRQHLRSGYLMRGRTVAELARTAGIDAQALENTIATFNADARAGRDPAFGKGTTPYNLRMGDRLHKPNPCVAPLEEPPFYAIKVVMGDIGTFAGLATDHSARVLAENGEPISGLYAAGNDMASVFGGTYPAGGTLLGPAVTFGFIAGRHLAGVGERARDAAGDGKS